MTNATFDPDQPHLAMKALRARRLTDPLGSMGFRKTRSRIERETRARKIAFVATIGLFTATFGIIASETGTGQSNVVLAQEIPAQVVQPASAQQSDGSGVVRSTTVRTVTKPVTTHVRTKSS